MGEASGVQVLWCWEADDEIEDEATSYLSHSPEDAAREYAESRYHRVDGPDEQKINVRADGGEVSTFIVRASLTFAVRQAAAGEEGR